MNLKNNTHKGRALYFASCAVAFAMMLTNGDSLRAQSATTSEPTAGAKKPALETVNPATGAHIIYYIPGQPMSSGAELGIDTKIEYRVMPGQEDVTTMTTEEKERYDIAKKKAYYESMGMTFDDGSAPAISREDAIKAAKEAHLKEQQRLQGVVPAENVKQNDPKPAADSPAPEKRAVTKPDYVHPPKTNSNNN